MKEKFVFSTANPVLNRPNTELAAFALLLWQPTGRNVIEEFVGRSLGANVEVIHNSGGDDPPDLEAFGLGIEVSFFPADQPPIDKARAKSHGNRLIPPYHRTGGNLKKILEQSRPSRVRPQYYDPRDLIEAYTAYAGGLLRRKDVTNNHILLLDQRTVCSFESPDEAIQLAIRSYAPTHLRLILGVREHETRVFYRRPRDRA